MPNIWLALFAQYIPVSTALEQKVRLPITHPPQGNNDLLIHFSGLSHTPRPTESSPMFPSPSTTTIPAIMASPVSHGWSGNSAQEKIVGALISRLSSRLPCHSGITLQALEADKAIQQLVETLLQIARQRLELIMHSLSDLLERITKSAAVDNEGNIALDVLHSQLYVLKVLSAAMTYRWECHRETLGEEADGKDSPGPSAPKPRPRQNVASPDEVHRPDWVEPPRLEDAVAKYALSVMVLFLRQTASVSDRPKTSGHMHSVAFPDFQPPEMVSPLPPSIRPQTNITSSKANRHFLGSRPSSNSLRGNGMARHPSAKLSISSSYATSETVHVNGGMPDTIPESAQPLPSDPTPSLTLMPPTPLTVSNSPSSINWLISKYAGKIVFHLSSSNWTVVFAKIRNKIHHLAQTHEDTPDMVDMKLVACSALDRTKLVQVMQELSSLLLNMKREAQGAVSIALRTAFWNWIEYFPNEFFDIFRGVRRLDGAPERVFDMLHNMTENQSKRAFWPTLAVLLAASPDRLKQATVGLPKSKKQQNNFVDTLVKSLGSTSKTAEIAMVCLIDLCKAAAYLPAEFDGTALRTLAPELADDLRHRIFSPSLPMKPFYETSDMIDVDLYADALVAIYRFSHDVALETIFPACIAPERSDAVKTCVLKACLTLVTETGKIPSQTPVSTLHSLVAARTRAIVRSAMSRKPEVPGMQTRRPIAKRYNQESFGDREQLLLTMFLLWRADPGFVFCGVTRNDPDYEALLAEGIKLFALPNDKAIRMGLFKAYVELATYALGLEQGDPWFEESRPHLLHTGASGTAAASVLLLDLHDSFEEDRNALTILNQVMTIQREAAPLLKAEGSPTASQLTSAFTLAEIALVLSLTSSQMDIPSLAADCLKRLVEMEKDGIIPMKNASPEELRAREAAYRALADTNVVVTGRMAMQKRIRKILQTMCFPNNVNVAVWEESYRRWLWISRPPDESDQNPSLPRPADRKSSQEDWQNVTFFLVSFGGCCLVDDQSLPPLSDVVDVGDLPSRFQKGGKMSSALVKQFIGQAVELCAAESASARQTIKDALGMELHPLLFPALFTYVDTVMTKIFDQQKPAWEEGDMIFIEQCIIVLRLIFDRIQNINETAHITVDIGRMIQHLTRFVHRSGTSPIAIRIKMKLAGLLDSLFLKRDILPLRKEVSLRNTLLDIVAEWAFDTSIPEWPYPEREGMVRMQGDLDIACLRTIVKLLERLQLQPVDGTTRSESVHVQSRLFYRYFNLFSKALVKWKEGEAADAESVSSGNVRARPTFKEQHTLRELIISGLTNLLSSNMEAGLKHCLPMGYNEDPRARRIFVHTFARVLQQETSLVAINSLEDNDRYSRLCEMVRAPDMLLALAICETCPQNDVDDMIGVLLNIFDTRGSLVALLKAMIDREVGATTDEASLFRGNSMCTRLLSAFARLHGYNYLRSLLLPMITQMSAMPPGHSYELDPSRLRDGEDVEENERNLKVICQAFLDVICNSVAILPTIFREICHHIAVTVTAIYPEAKYAAVGGFIFLRFICPTIVSPSSVDIELPADNPAIHRGLVLITKIIQNLANNILFGKEAFMMSMNSFLTSNIMPVTRFLSDVLKYVPAPGDADQLEWLGMAYDETDHMLLHRYFRANTDKVGKELLSYPSTPSARDAEQTPAGGKQTWDVLCATLVEIGDPLEIPKPSAMTSAQHALFQDFLQRNGHRNMDSVKEIFLGSAAPQDRSPVFILSLHKLNVETVDLELLAAFIFKTLMSAESNGQFDLIVDCTSFTSTSEVPIQWFKFFLELAPWDFIQRWSTTYILNPNTYSQKFLRKLYHLFSSLNVSKHVVAVSSVAELLPMIHSTVVGLMSYPVGLEREAKETFLEVKKLDRHRMSVPISLQVGATHLRITSTKPKQIWGSSACKLTEIILLTDVDDVYNVSTGHEVNEFVIRRNRTGGTMYFSSPTRDAIVKAIRTAKGKLKADGSSTSMERPIQLGNLTATLLNVGLLNVTSDDENLRGAAYDLLCAVCKHLQCDDVLMLPTDGAFIPSNPAAFAIPFSERAAKFAPQLTLDLLSEFFVGFKKSSPTQKAVCLQYINPWVQNLSGFQNPTVSYYEHSGAKLRDAIRSMIDITYNYHEMFPMLQRLMWSEVAKLDNRVINITLDELFRTAIDGGIASRRCEAIAETLVVLGSINVRGKVLAKLRRVLGKTLTRPTKTLVENPAWNEVAALTRLTLLVMYNVRVPIQTQLFVPEVLHLVTMIVSTGPVVMRTAVHGMVTNLVQSLCVMRTDDEVSKDRLRRTLRDCFKPDVLRLFGLAREDASSEYTLIDNATEQISVDSLEKITLFLLDIVDAGAQTTGLANVWRARWVGLVTSTAFQLSAYIQSRAFVVLGTLASSDVDDDLLYQILVAFRTALATSSETDTSAVVSMLRCIRKVVPGLPENSRYLAQILWLAIALIQSSYISLFSESARLLQATLETLQGQGAFETDDLPRVLMAARDPLEDISSQLDNVLGLSFDASFSFSLATAIFKGVRHPPTTDAAVEVLHTLLRMSSMTPQNLDIAPDNRPVGPESLGFFVALLPLTRNISDYKKLLEEAGVGSSWVRDVTSASVEEEDEEALPKVPFGVLGVQDGTNALLVVSFLVAMANSAHNGKELELLFTLLASIADEYPDVVALAYEGLMEKINDILSSSKNPRILEACGVIFRIAVTEQLAGDGRKPSSLTFMAAMQNGSTNHLFSLKQIGMLGLANNHQFLPPARSLPLIKWINELVTRIIE
ncbi:Ras GTPase activating protein ira2 [Tulasnella sp. 403]|nr:Ras GTPase activating protein ira2 [Tulasnella sp. 403]